MRKYNVYPSNNTSSPPLADTWTAMEKELSPAFQQTRITMSGKSPLSSSSTAKAIERVNYTSKLREVFERNSESANCQALITGLARTKSASGPRSFRARSPSATGS